MDTDLKIVHIENYKVRKQVREIILRWTKNYCKISDSDIERITNDLISNKIINLPQRLQLNETETQKVSEIPTPD